MKNHKKESVNNVTIIMLLVAVMIIITELYLNISLFW